MGADIKQQPDMSMWDQRYDTADYVYGTQPNSFLAEHANKMKTGSALCLAAGEGRNAVWLAKKGFAVTAVDSSTIGLQKAQRLAKNSTVTIDTIVADLADFEINHQDWDLITSIFCHLPKAVRVALHKKVVAGLKPGGYFILQAYTPQQLNFGTGGPPVQDLLVTLASLRRELVPLELLLAEETVCHIIEGRLHSGEAAVVQIVAQKKV